LLSLIGFFLEFPFRDFGDEVKNINTSIYLRYSEQAEIDYSNKYANSWLEKYKPTPVKFNRSKSELQLKYISNVSTAEIELFHESTDAETFSRFCLEFIDKLGQIRKRIRETDDFKLNDFLRHLEEKRAQLPLSESALEVLRNQAENFVWPKRKTEKMEKRPKSALIPQTITIAPSYPIEDIGTYSNGQFWGHVIDESMINNKADSDSGVYSMIHLFDKNGKFEQTKFEKISKTNENAYALASEKLDEMIAFLPGTKFQSISIELFEDEVDGIQIGLFDESDDDGEELIVVLAGRICLSSTVGWVF